MTLYHTPRDSLTHMVPKVFLFHRDSLPRLASLPPPRPYSLYCKAPLARQPLRSRHRATLSSETHHHDPHSPKNAISPAPQSLCPSAPRFPIQASTRRCVVSSTARGAPWTWSSATRRAAATGFSAGSRRKHTAGTFLSRSCPSTPASTIPTIR